MALTYFAKITTDENNEFGQWLLKQDGLYWKIIWVAICRARKSESKLYNLKEGEFFLSKNEYKLFGLKASQSNKLLRAIDKLIKIGLFEKIEDRRGSKNSTIYKVNTEWMDFFEFSTKSKQKMDSRTDNRVDNRTDNRKTKKNK